MSKFTKKCRNIAVCGLLALTCAFSLGAIACSDDAGASEAPQISEFANQTIGVGYNTDFSLSPYITGVDQNGTPYLGTAKVRDSKGNEVTLFENRFYVTDLEGYTVEVTLVVDGKTYTKTLTVEVQDHSLPVITMAGMKQGEVGAEYVLPAIQVTKAFDETEIVPTVKVYYESGNVSEEQTVTNGKFTPTKKGEYRIEVTAVDQYGGKKSYEESFVIRSKMADNMLEDFNDAEYSILSAQVQKKAYGQDVTWLDSYQGATGVVKTKTSDGFTPRYGMSKLALKTGRTRDELLNMDFDYINIRTYIDKAGTFVIGSKDCRFDEVAGQQWVNIQLSKADILQNAQYSNSLYVAESPDDPYGKFAELHGANGTGDYLFYVTLKGELPAEYADWNAFQADTEAYAAATKATQGVEIYIDSISYAKLTVGESGAMQKGVEFTLPTLTMTGFNGTMDVAANTSVKVLWNGTTEVPTAGGKLTPAQSGTYVLEYTVNHEGVTYTASKTYLIPRTIPEGYLEDFGELASIGTVYTGNASGVKGSSAEWAESHTTSDNVTKTGALKVVLNNANNGQNGYLWLQLNQTTAELEAMNIQSIDITFSAWNENTNWHGLHIADDNTVPLKSANIWSTAWYTVTITVEQLKSIPRFQKADGEMDWSKLSSDGENTWLIRSNQSTADTLYIDSITYTSAQ